MLDAALAELGGRIAAGPVKPAFDQAAFCTELAAYDFTAPVAMESVVPWVMAQLETGIVQITHPRYFGLFNPRPTQPALCADRIANAFNPQLASATTSPAPVAIEAHVIRAVAARAGLPAGAGGHFTTGGSEANFTGLICALTAATPAFAKEGARCFAGQPVFYVSVACHLAWIKIAHMAGIGRAAARLIATDGAGRMSVPALAAAIAEDRAAGAVPVMIVATAGTTGAGMIDPLTECAALARWEGLWLHVDAAWGGALIASTFHARALAGMAQADSVTIDAHKWFATTMGCGMFLARNGAALPAVFGVANDFMPPGEAVADPYHATMQWSRRFLGLRLFLSLAAAGWGGYARHVEGAIELAALLKAEMGKRGWAVANASPLAVVCLVPPAGSPEAVVAEVVKSGLAWVSVASHEGQKVVRACITNGMTTRADVLALADALAAAAAGTTLEPVATLPNLGVGTQEGQAGQRVPAANVGWILW